MAELHIADAPSNVPAQGTSTEDTSIRRSAFRNRIYFNDADQGGRFAMWEHPELFAAELRAAFHSLR